MKIVGDASASSFEHEELHSEAEVDLVGHFLQEAQDYGEMWSDMEAAARVRATFKMASLLRELEQAGFCVFGDRENQRMEGGVGPPSAFPVAILRIIRSTNPEIMRLGLQGKPEGTAS